MLKQLYIENIAVIEKASLELEEGLNLLTGETGAGKSIIIDSLNAILGERTSRELIRTGCEQAKVSALFTDINPAVRFRLEELGYSADDGELLLQRTLRTDGKSVCRIGGQPATASLLREVGRLLVNIHGQHDNQALLNIERHLTFVDKLAHDQAQLNDYQATYQTVRRLQKALDALQMDEAEKARRMDLLSFQVRELEEAALRPGEREDLTHRRALIQNSERVAQELGAAYGALAGGEDTAGAIACIQAAENAARDAAKFMEELDEPVERLTTLQYELEELADGLRQRLEQIEYDPQELENIEERLDQLYHLSRKYGETEEDMLAFLAQADTELSQIASSEEKQAEIEAALEKEKSILVEKGRRLTQARRRAGDALADAVCKVLAFLNMPGVTFITKIESSGEYHASGADRVEFLISANPGEPPKPLSKIASGGELSRIMLAIKSVLADQDEVDTLVFDEIDTGISGRAAQKVGVKLKEVSKRRQVICITHLAQIAALANHHMLIEKKIKKDRTYTEVRAIGGEDRVEEIARLMSGGELSEPLRQTAVSLIEAGLNI